MKATIIVCISGWTQSRGKYHGILQLREKLIAEGHAHGVANRVWYLPWTTNWSGVANDLSIICNQHGMKPMVLVAGYSYGGWAALRFAYKLWEHGIGVQNMILCDPVARPWYWPRPIPSLTSLLGRERSFAMRVPNNVVNLYEYYQLENRPQGHKLITGNGTFFEHSVKLQVPHDRMDDAPEFQGCVMKYANEMRECCEGETTS